MNKKIILTIITITLVISPTLYGRENNDVLKDIDKKIERNIKLSKTGYILSVVGLSLIGTGLVTTSTYTTINNIDSQNASLPYLLWTGYPILITGGSLSVFGLIFWRQADKRFYSLYNNRKEYVEWLERYTNNYK